MRNINYIRLLLLLFAVCSIIWLLNSCSSVKQVLKDPEKTNQVVTSWLKHNPLKPDTQYIKGKDSLRIDTLESKESVYVDCPDTGTVIKVPVKVKCPPAKIITKEHFRTDTVKWEDFKKLDLIKKDNAFQAGQITQLTADKKFERKRGNKFLWWLIGLGVLIIGTRFIKYRYKINWL